MELIEISRIACFTEFNRFSWIAYRWLNACKTLKRWWPLQCCNASTLYQHCSVKGLKPVSPHNFRSASFFWAARSIKEIMSAEAISFKT